jgi:hypothetical protein
VFVDDTGRRRRLSAAAGLLATAGCLCYLGAAGLGLSEDEVGPLLAVPARGNGLIAGFGTVPGGVPGLLAARALGRVLHPHPAGHRVLTARGSEPVGHTGAAAAAYAAQPSAARAGESRKGGRSHQESARTGSA